MIQRALMPSPFGSCLWQAQTLLRVAEIGAVVLHGMPLYGPATTVSDSLRLSTSSTERDTENASRSCSRLPKPTLLQRQRMADGGNAIGSRRGVHPSWVTAQQQRAGRPLKAAP